jgi:hypothetical protein
MGVTKIVLDIRNLADRWAYDSQNHAETKISVVKAVGELRQLAYDIEYGIKIDSVDWDGSIPEPVKIAWWQRQLVSKDLGLSVGSAIGFTIFTVFVIMGFKIDTAFLAFAIIALIMAEKMFGIWEPENDEIDSGPILGREKVIMLGGWLDDKISQVKSKIKPKKSDLDEE